jgi:hypothetical protein
MTTVRRCQCRRGRRAWDVPANAPEISPLDNIFLMARGQVAADVLVARPFKLRFSAGFNYPGCSCSAIEAVYLFGTGR